MRGRALITSVRGITGRYLADVLHQAGYEVFGLEHTPRPLKGKSLQELVACDLSDRAGLVEAIAKVRPDVVAHLAAIAFVGHGDVDVDEIYRTNLTGSRNLLGKC